ncbi:MAG: cell division protein FtsZ [Lachnospirales bacterium]
MVTGEFKEKDFTGEAMRPKIAIIGIGGAGNNAVNHMIDKGIDGVDFISMNTDNQDLLASKALRKLQLGIKSSEGLGAGGLPEYGKKAAEESRQEIADLIQGYHLVFLTAGMGGGTGTGATPIVAKIAKDMGILTMAIVTKPFIFEGSRVEYADEGVDSLKENVDCLIVIPNDKILDLVEDDTTDLEALKKTDEVLFLGVSGIASIINANGVINLDFKDLRNVLKDSGIAYMGIGQASGDKAIDKALKIAINNPLVDEKITGGSCGLISIHSAKASFKDTAKSFAEFKSFLKDNPKMYNGIYKDESLGDTIFVTVIVTGLNSNAQVDVEKEVVTANEETLDQATEIKSNMQLGDTSEIPIVTEAKVGVATNNRELTPISRRTIDIPPVFGRR